MISIVIIIVDVIKVIIWNLTAYHTKEIKMSQWQFVDKKNNDYISKNKILENKSSMNLLYV